jgi:hypothetical protein
MTGYPWSAGQILTAADLNAAFGIPINLASPPPIGGTLANTGAFSTLQVGGGATISGFGTAIGQALGPLTNAGDGSPLLSTSGTLIFQRATQAPTNFADFQFKRSTTFTGGTSTTINSILRIAGSYGAGDSSANWPFLVEGTTFGSNGMLVSSTIHARRQSGSTNPMWGEVFDVADFTGDDSNGKGQVVGIELGVRANGADDAANGGSWGGTGVRKGLHLVIARGLPGNPADTVVSHGIWFAANTASGVGIDPGVSFSSLLGVSTGTPIRSFVDSRGAGTVIGNTNPINAVTMTVGHVIDFNGGASLTSAPGNYLQYTATGTARLRYMAGVTEVFSIDNSGKASISGLSINGLAASPSYANDTAAAAGGVGIDRLYRNGNFVMVRLV